MAMSSVSDYVSDMGHRVGIKMFVSPEEKAAFDEMLRGMELGHKEATTNMVRWLLAADPVIQCGVLGKLPRRYEAEVAMLALARLAGIEARPSKAIRAAAASALALIPATQALPEKSADSESTQEAPQQSRRRKLAD
jgi:hypothetical protein